jgi:general L-amino acid transport system permease protein
LGKAFGTLWWLRTAMIVFWLVGPAFLVFLVLRDPSFDWEYVATVDLPLAAAFAIGGGALLYAITKPGLEEPARFLGVVLLAFSVFNWVAAFFGWFGMLQKVRFSFLLLALFVLIAPTFSGDKPARLRFAGIWLSLMVLMHWLITGINTPSTLDIQAPPFLGGLVLTLTIAYYVMLASFPLGVILALARTSKMPIFRILSTLYIEFIRGIPLITVLFFFSIMLPLFLPDGMGISELAAIFAGYSVFSAAYMAENVRGGLQSIRKGQYEASDALGLTTVQRTSFIVLPQALRVSIPNIVGQAIATFKETSLIAIVGGFDLLRVADKSIAAQPEFLGQKRPALLFVCFVYWIFAYSMSRASRNLEVRLGVGQGR